MRIKKIKRVYYEVYEKEKFVGYKRKKNSKEIYDSLSELCADEDSNDFGG